LDFLESKLKIVGDNNRSNGDIHVDNPRLNNDLLAINLDPTTSISANLVTWIPNDLIIVGERPYEEYAK
jgi:hypothetical protein